MTDLLKRRLVRLVLVLYLLTWLFGAPAVQSAFVQETLEENAATPWGIDRSLSWPLQRTYFAAPLLPGIVVSFRFQRIDTFGVFMISIDAWYLAGVANVANLPFGSVSIHVIR